MQDSSCLHLMLQCRPPLDGFLNETLQGMERSLTPFTTVVPDKGWNVHSLHGVLWYQTRGGTCLYSWSAGFLCNVLADLIVLTGGLWTTWDVILALEVTVGGRWVKTCGDEAVCPHTQEQCSDALYSTSNLFTVHHNMWPWLCVSQWWLV